MTETATPVDESLQTLDFKDFDPNKLSSLTNWTVLEIESSLRWFFSHKEFDNSENGTFLFEVYKPISPMEGTMHVNRVSLNIKTPHNVIQGHLLEVQSFAFGTSGISLPGEGQIVRFFGKDGSSLEIRNDGSVWTRNLTEGSYIPLNLQRI